METQILGYVLEVLFFAVPGLIGTAVALVLLRPKQGRANLIFLGVVSGAVGGYLGGCVLSWWAPTASFSDAMAAVWSTGVIASLLCIVIAWSATRSQARLAQESGRKTEQEVKAGPGA